MVFSLGCDSIFIFFARSVLFAQLTIGYIIYYWQPLHPCVYYLCETLLRRAEAHTAHTEAHRSDFVRMTYISSIAISERMCTMFVCGVCVCVCVANVRKTQHFVQSVRLLALGRTSRETAQFALLIFFLVWPPRNEYGLKIYIFYQFLNEMDTLLRLRFNEMMNYARCMLNGGPVITLQYIHTRHLKYTQTHIHTHTSIHTFIRALGSIEHSYTKSWRSAYDNHQVTSH